MNVAQKELVEKLSSSFSIGDVPPSTLRVLAWLLVAHAPEQSAETIQKELDMSSGSVSMALNTLHYLGLIERTSVPGSRRLRYRVAEDMTALLAERQAASFRRLNEVTHEALKQNPNNTRLRAAKASSGRLIDLFRSIGRGKQ